MQKSNHRRNEDIVGFIALFSKLLNRSLRIVCNNKLENLSVQVGLPPVVGSGYGRFEVLGSGVRVRMTHGVTIVAFSPREGPEYADQAVTGRSRGVCWR